jgi:hypothetical protein
MLTNSIRTSACRIMTATLPVADHFPCNNFMASTGKPPAVCDESTLPSVLASDAGVINRVPQKRHETSAESVL